MKLYELIYGNGDIAQTTENGMAGFIQESTTTQITSCLFSLISYTLFTLLNNFGFEIRFSIKTGLYLDVFVLCLLFQCILFYRGCDRIVVGFTTTYSVSA